MFSSIPPVEAHALLSDTVQKPTYLSIESNNHYHSTCTPLWHNILEEDIKENLIYTGRV